MLLSQLGMKGLISDELVKSSHPSIKHLRTEEIGYLSIFKKAFVPILYSLTISKFISVPVIRNISSESVRHEDNAWENSWQAEPQKCVQLEFSHLSKVFQNFVIIKSFI